MTDDNLTPDDLARMNGCKPMPQGTDGRPSYYCGWSPTDPLLLDRITVPHGEVSDGPTIAGDHVFLWEFIWHAARRAESKIPVYNGYWPMNWQLTGSCVKGGFENAMKVSLAVDMVCRPEAEAAVEPFVFPCYGQGRYDAYHTTSEGDGCEGGAIANAAATIGIPPMDDPDAVPPHLCGPAQVWDAATELHWSSVKAITQGMKDRSKVHSIAFVRVRNPDEAEAQLRLGRPLTWCGNWGGIMGAGRVQGSTAPLLMMPHNSSWGHQESCLGVWANHPDFRARRWRIQNQWWQDGTVKRSGGRILAGGIAKPFHGPDPAIPGWTRPPILPGGYWVTDDDMDYQCSRGEVIAIAAFSGYDGREIGLGSI